MIAYLIASYLYFLLCVMGLMVASIAAKPRSGFDLVIRVALIPVVLPFLIIHHLIKPRWSFPS
jgi:hypothetical protein